MRDLKSDAERLRALHGQPLVLANVWDAATAKVVEDLGFPAVATSSAAVALSRGADDTDSMDPDVAFGAVAIVSAAVSVPVTADLEAGYQLPAEEFVGRLLEAGAVGCNFEDTDHHGDNPLVPVDVHAARVAALKDAGRSAGVDIVVNARCDAFARGVESPLDETLRRGRAYREAGADCVYPIVASAEDDIKRLVDDLGPINIWLGRSSPSIARLTELGVARISVGSGLFRQTMEFFREAAAQVRGVTRAIAVASGKGGVGKSTVALNLAAALARRPARVGLLDADLYGPDIPRMLGLSREERATGLDLWIKGDPKKTKVPVVERYGLKIASVQFLIAEDQSISFDSALVGLLLRRLAGADWGELDFLIIDLPPGTADIQQQVATMVNLVGVLLVVTPQDVAHLDARKLLDMLDNRGLPVIGAVENMAWMACPHCGEQMSVFPTTAESRTIWSKVDRLAQLPMEPELARAAERGVLADGPMSALFDTLADDIIGRLGA